jgi:type IV pilus assembly protein PilW
MNAIESSERMRRGQNGFSLIEIMIALLIGLFLLSGLMTMVQDNRRVFGNQNQLAQLQDSERVALTMMTDVIQTAGYFPDPTSNSAQSTMLASAAPAMVAGQAMAGTDNAGVAPGDTITVRYATSSGDGILNCAGTSNSTGGIFTFVNTFSVAVNPAGVSQLLCTQNGTPYPLVNGVQNLTLRYGVNTTGSGSNVDSYQTAAQVTAAANWNNVISVQVALTFTNPLYLAPGQGQPATIVLQRNIAVMNQTGL